jgi:hypothetical protein
VQTTQARHIGNGFDIEDEYWLHAQAGKTPVER